jgi:3-hydroxyisobutyrate dehydrogenase-like beta-hydroxyacid dehydrogenase
VEYALKDMDYFLEFAAQVGLDPKGAKNAMAALERAAVAGNRKKYWPVLVKTI